MLGTGGAWVFFGVSHGRKERRVPLRADMRFELSSPVVGEYFDGADDLW